MFGAKPSIFWNELEVCFLNISLNSLQLSCEILKIIQIEFSYDLFSQKMWKLTRKLCSVIIYCWNIELISQVQLEI